MSEKERKDQIQTESPETPGRRDALKKILGLGAGLAAVSALPAQWSPAVVESLAGPGQGHGGGRGRGHCDHGQGRGRGHDGDDCGGAPTTRPPVPTTRPPVPTTRPPVPTTAPPPQPD